MKRQEIKDHEEKIARTTFAPEHLTGGILKPSALPSKDLTDRGFSVDRCKWVIPSVVFARLNRQSAGRENRMERHVSIVEISEFSHLILPLDGFAAFSIFADPVRGNAAHAVVRSARPGRSRSQVKQLKSLLIPLLEQNLSDFEEFDTRLSKIASRKGPINRAKRAILHFASYRYSE